MKSRKSFALPELTLLEHVRNHHWLDSWHQELLLHALPVNTPECRCIHKKSHLCSWRPIAQSLQEKNPDYLSKHLCLGLSPRTAQSCSYQLMG